MSEKFIQRVAVGTALLGATAATAALASGDRVGPEAGNDPAAVARFNEALHGKANLTPITENPANHKVDVTIPYIVQPGDNAIKIKKEHPSTTDSVGDIQHEGSGPGHMLMAGDHIKLNEQPAGSDVLDQNQDIPTDKHQFGE